jgi:hypothetical protein
MASGSMPDKLLARADAAIEHAQSLHIDRCALLQDLDLSRAQLRDSVLDSSVVTAESRQRRTSANGANLATARNSN